MASAGSPASHDVEPSYDTPPLAINVVTLGSFSLGATRRSIYWAALIQVSPVHTYVVYTDHHQALLPSDKINTAADTNSQAVLLVLVNERCYDPISRISLSPPNGHTSPEPIILGCITCHGRRRHRLPQASGFAGRVRNKNTGY